MKSRLINIITPLMNNEKSEGSSSSSLFLSSRAQYLQKLSSVLGTSFLFLVTSLSAIAVIFIFIFIFKDAFPFFQLEGFKEFFTSSHWYPSAEKPEFGCIAIFFGSALVTLGASLVAMPLGISAALCLSDILPFSFRQYVKPVTEILAAIPSVAYGFFAVVVFAPALQDNGGALLKIAAWCFIFPVAVILSIVLSDLFTTSLEDNKRRVIKTVILCLLLITALLMMKKLSLFLNNLEISSGTNALNVSIILGIMALPTVVSVSEDALQSVGRELREASYALGSTRAETLFKVVLPAASSGIFAAVLLGLMRALGETMVVWMASGNAAQIPEPWYNFLEPVRTLTATIAGDMGEADHVTGSSRYHVLFAMAFCLLSFSFISNVLSEWIVHRQQKKLGKL